VPEQRSTNIRNAVLTATTLVAVIMYVDRVFLGWMLGSDSFAKDIPLDKASKAAIKDAFFWAYALGQVPAALLAERYGKRTLMTLMILSWSAFTLLTGCANGFWILWVARIGFGFAQAGAYPVAGGLLNHWAHIHWRGFASSIVALGGRIGAVLAPAITSVIIVNCGSWRWSAWIFGGTGLLVALYFGLVFRETPAEHPACNDQERSYLNEGRPHHEQRPPTPFPWRDVLTNRSLWLMCAVQFLTNIGWVFILNSLPDYLKDVHRVSDALNGPISTCTMSIGMFGMLAGGFFTDFCARRFGVRLGRLIPLVSTRFLAGIMFFLCIFMPDMWSVVVLLGLMAFTSDAGVPSMWAFAQDVGGRRTASVLGWANMWGNFGAAVQGSLVALLLKQYDTNNDYQEGFLVSGFAFILAGVLGLGINAAKPVDRSESTP